MIPQVDYGITDGALVTYLRSGLSEFATGLTFQRKLPATLTRRMGTVRNDSGPYEYLRSFRRYGINLWSDDSVDAENMGNEVVRLLLTIPGTGLFTSVDGVSGPREIEDSPQFTVSNKPLFHFYVTARLGVRST